MPRGVLLTSLCLAWAALAPVTAQGATTLGHTQSSNTACAAPSTVDVQTATGAGQGTYTVPAGGGVITGWQHQARQIAGAQLKLKVLRPVAPPLAGPEQFAVVGETPFSPVPDPQLYSYPARIPVKAGDMIGLATASNAAASPPACNTNAVGADEVYEGADFAGSATLNPFNTFRLNIAATLEPDADADGFGDETQDKCKGQAGPTDGCGGKTKKKCKKRKGKGKGKSGAGSAKKKCKKGKKRK